MVARIAGDLEHYLNQKQKIPAQPKYTEASINMLTELLTQCATNVEGKFIHFAMEAEGMERDSFLHAPRSFDYVAHEACYFNSETGDWKWAKNPEDNEKPRCLQLECEVPFFTIDFLLRKRKSLIQDLVRKQCKEREFALNYSQG
jgi:hypothetical protein